MSTTIEWRVGSKSHFGNVVASDLRTSIGGRIYNCQQEGIVASYRGKFFIMEPIPAGYLCHDGERRTHCADTGENMNGWYDTLAEAEQVVLRENFAALLHTDPRAALRPFLEAAELEYQGTCGECGARGYKRQRSGRSTGGMVCGGFGCPTCHGTGGPPDRLMLAAAADWFEERGRTMEAGVLRSITPNEKVS